MNSRLISEVKLTRREAVKFGGGVKGKSKNSRFTVYVPVYVVGLEYQNKN